MIKKKIPIWEKDKLTLEEACDYTGIGINKLRTLTDIPNCKFIIWNGYKRIIKRRELEKFIDNTKLI